MNRFMLLLALAGLLCFQLPALADEESYQPLSSAPGDYRLSAASPLDGADSLAAASPLKIAGTDTSLIPTKGNPTLYVSADFSVEAATATLYCYLYVQTARSSYTFMGVAGVQTATGGTGPTRSSRYLHQGLLMFDTGCATHVEIRKSDPSSGTIALRAWCGGSDPSSAGDE